MTAFEPGEGWRRLRIDEVLEDGAEVINYSNGDGIRAWVREEPVPALPTEPYTVIRVTWKPESFGSAVTGIPDHVLHDVDAVLAADLTGPVARTEAIADIDPAKLPALVAALATHVNLLHAARPAYARYRAAAVEARVEADHIHRGGAA